MRPLERISEAIQKQRAQRVFALFSGGDDSLTAALLASQHPAFSACVHIDTGIAVWDADEMEKPVDERISVARKFVERTCKERNWPLIVYRAVDYRYADGRPNPQRYEDLVMNFGFPGATEIGHGHMYKRLKYSSLVQLKRDTRPDRIVLVAGCRHGESTRRMGVREMFDPWGRAMWCNPIIDWDKPQCHEMIADTERNPCSIQLCRSGECMCGAFATKGEADKELRYFYPHMTEYLHGLEQRVYEAGYPWAWDESPPKWWVDQKKGQPMLFAMERPLHLCQSCIVKETV